ncbi:hypothetical protein BS78_05G218200 [Paspalum vaginatum]|nr:hypothetical protein BS78_05G218200 [Paspalum vaginatum]
MGGLRNVRATLLKCGEDKLLGDGSGAEYPCMRRFRYRRLFTFLFRQGFKATTHVLLDESHLFLSATRLTELVERDQWQDSIRYLSRFLPLHDANKRLMSVPGQVLHMFLKEHQVLASIVATRGKSCPFLHQAEDYLEDDSKTIFDGGARLRSIRSNILCSQQVRDSIDWKSVSYEAAGVVMDLVFRIPELADWVLTPGGPMDPQDVLPIDASHFGLRPRCHAKKQALRPKAPDLVEHYLKTLRSLPASSDPSRGSHDDDCLKAGKRRMLPLQTSGTKDDCLKAGKRRMFPLQTSGTKAVKYSGPAVNTVMPSFPNTAIKYPGPAINTVMPSVPNTAIKYPGPIVSTVRPSVPDTGATAAPVSEIMFCRFPCPIINPWVPSVASAGKLASQEPTTISPFLGTTHTSRGQVTSSGEQDYLKRQLTTEASVKLTW